MSDDEKERIARLETKVDMIHKDITAFKTEFHKDFESHKKEDDSNFKLLTTAINNNSIRQAKTETRLGIYIAIGTIVASPIITAIIKHFMG